MKTDWKMETDDFLSESDDSREKLEADIARYFACWLRGGGENTLAVIIGWLDRQVAITTRECTAVYELGCEACRAAQKREIASMQAKLDKCYKPNWEYCETCERLAELQAKLDAYDETHMELPVDADGVPIRVGDMVSLNNREPFEVGGVRDTRNQWHVFPYDLQRWYAPLDLHHVKPRTIEDVLADVRDGNLDTGYAAAELRELMGSDGA